MTEAEQQEQVDQQEMEGSQQNSQQDEEGEEFEEDQMELEKNNHDLIGIEGIIAAQKNEIDGKKVSEETVRNGC